MSAAIKLYYHPLPNGGRAAACLRLLEHTSTPFEWIKDRAELTKVCGAFGADSTDTFAPPVVMVGDYSVCQSTATVFYLGKKLGLVPPAFDDAKAMQHLIFIQDVFEGNLGKKNESGPDLKAFLEGPRWVQLMSTLERSIKGPYFFGDTPCCVDFFLLAHLDARIPSIFEPLQEKYGVDKISMYPKCLAIRTALSSTDAYRASSLAKSKPLKDEILDNYK